MRLISIKMIFLILITQFYWDSNLFAKELTSEKTVLDKALSVYIDEGVEGLTRVLTIPGLEKMALAQINALKQIEAYYGKAKSYSKIKKVNLNRSTTIVTFIIDYSHGPLFGVATIYRQGGKEMISHMKYHTNPFEILPPHMMFK